MRLIEVSASKKLPETIKNGETFEEPKTYYVENAKGNTIPKHFTKEENTDRKDVVINGVKTTVYRSKERSEYVAFQLGEQAHYVRGHDMLEAGKEFVTYVKPKREAPPKKEKPVKAEDLVPVAKKNYEVTDVKAGQSVTMTGKEFIAKFGLEKATKILNGRTTKTFTADEYAGEITPAETESSDSGDTGAA